MALQPATILYLIVLVILMLIKIKDAKLIIARLTTVWVVIAAVVVGVLAVAV